MTTLNALVLSLPTHNSTMRMRVWRALKETGCGVLRDGVYVLPQDAGGGGVLTKVESEIRSAGGFAMTVELKLKGSAQRATVRKLFDRSAGYGELKHKVSAVSKALPRLGHRKAQTAVQRLERAFDKLAEIDFFPGQAKLQAAESISRLKRSLRDAYSRGEPRTAKKRLRLVDKHPYQKRTWATRKNPWLHRLASAWLIKRFVDPQSKVAWIAGPCQRPGDTLRVGFDRAALT